ncbi:hypothetical protein D1AOALGA4SA_5973 [Olavius algarvensis Delta 1 endosymbiont]|nr:hypothetical protein D1AOALGA4SA_5973 [Olavius algarvensis Delta 1 endosymbiont]
MFDIRYSLFQSFFFRFNLAFIWPAVALTPDPPTAEHLKLVGKNCRLQYSSGYSRARAPKI